MLSARNGKKTQGNIAEYNKPHFFLWNIFTPDPLPLTSIPTPHPPLLTNQDPKNPEADVKESTKSGVKLAFKILRALVCLSVILS